MKWYLKVVKDNYANFNGRASRKEYWMFFLFNIIIYIAVGVLSAVISPFLLLIYGLAIIIPSIAVGARRLHDVGKPGWFFLLGIIPFVNVYILVLSFFPSIKGANKYGEEPE